jgi:hypothetical protein
MGAREKSSGVSAFAVAGAHVVTVGFDVTAAKREGLPGFSLHQTDHDEDERFWLAGDKLFDLPGGAVISPRAASAAAPPAAAG